MIEIERYELNEGPAYKFEPDRRQFVQGLSLGLLFLLALDGDAAGQESGGTRKGGRGGDAMPQELAAWLHIDEDGSISVFTGKAEMGQNIRTSLAQAVAEELRCPPSSIHMVMADTDLTPFDMGTFGSRTTPFMAPQLRKVAAAARESLVDLASAQWKADRGTLRVENGFIENPSTGEKLRFSDLTHGRQLTTIVDAGAPLTPATEWKIAGRSVPKADAEAFVTGRHQYTSDMARPGMLHGRVLRPISYGAKLVSVESNGSAVVRDGDFAGVVGANEFAATKALHALKAEWKEEPQPGSNELFSYLKANPERASDKPPLDLTAGEPAHTAESTYTIAYIAHTPLEPRAAVAEWTGDKLTVWTGTQRPFGVKAELSQAFGIPENRVRVIVPDTGSGYGGKHTGECAIEASRLAKSAGKPVKVVWTREEEFTWAYFRPAGVIDIRAGVSKDGVLTSWEFHNYNSGGSGIETPYNVKNQSVQFHATKSPLRQGSYRGLAATANHFARESQMDDLAHLAGIDPLAFRYKNLSNPRMKAVLAAAAERFGWGKNREVSGLACGFEKGGYVACCAQVSAPSLDKIKIERVTIAFECGAIVNPKHLENQVEGSVVMALGGALFEQVDFSNGRIENGKLSRYRVPRFSDLPAIEVVLVDRKDLPSAGAGETPIVGLAPAVGNAIYAARGVRAKALPMLPALARSTS